MFCQARNIEYKDPAEEEWALFQKEIVQELDTAQEMVTEDRQEATVGRQLEEIDEQMRAWSRVSQMEKKLSRVEEKVHEKKNQTDNDLAEESSSDEEEFDEFNWRKKS